VSIASPARILSARRRRLHREVLAVQAEALLWFWMEDGQLPQRRDNGKLGVAKLPRCF
jgi:hypothetical protein